MRNSLRFIQSAPPKREDIQGDVNVRSTTYSHEHTCTLSQRVLFTAGCSEGEPINYEQLTLG